MKDIFKEYDIKLNLVELKKILEKLDQDGGGTLDIEEFREWNNNKEARNGFRTLVKDVRAELELNNQPCGQLPFEFCVMLEYLTNKMTRDAIRERIDSK